jgi:hypothetical protein
MYLTPTTMQRLSETAATLDEESKNAWKDKDKHLEQFQYQIAVTKVLETSPEHGFWEGARSGSLYEAAGPFRVLISDISTETVGVLIRPEYDVLWRTAEPPCQSRIVFSAHQISC